MSAIKPTRRSGRREIGSVQLINTDRIVTRPQTRKTMDQVKLRELAENIKKHGQKQPGAVYWDEKNAIYVVAFGHRRYEACKLAGIPFKCTVLEKAPTEKELLDLQVIENEQREDVNQLERAKAYHRAMELNEFSSNRQLAEHFNVSDSTISFVFSILDLPDEGQQRIGRGESVKAVLKAYAAKPRRSRGHGKKRTLSLGGGKTILLAARRPVEDDLAYDMLRAALALIPRPVAVEDTPELTEPQSSEDTTGSPPDLRIADVA